jgi:hypothetical protein
MADRCSEKGNKKITTLAIAYMSEAYSGTLWHLYLRFTYL